MCYDEWAESVALIESGHLDPVPRLSRRRRFAAMAVDVADDVAATMFARRGVGCVWEEVHVFALREGRWHPLGGGGASHVDDNDLLADRPHVIPEALRGSRNVLTGVDPRVMVMVTDGGAGGVHDEQAAAGRCPSGGRWISYAIMRASARVDGVQVDERNVVVPWHGRTLSCGSGVSRRG